MSSFGDRLLLTEMLSSAEQIVDATRDIDLQTFQASALHRAAISMHLLALGEGARRLTPETMTSAPEVAWSDMFGLRNRLAHAYARASTVVLFQAAKVSIPALIPVLQRLLEQLGPEP